MKRFACAALLLLMLLSMAVADEPAFAPIETWLTNKNQPAPAP